MSDRWKTDVRAHVGIADEAIGAIKDRGDRWTGRPSAESKLQTRVKTIERTAIVRFEDAQIVYDESDVQAIGDQIGRLIVDEGHTRLLLNFGGVRYLSSDVLG